MSTSLLRRPSTTRGKGRHVDVGLIICALFMQSVLKATSPKTCFAPAREHQEFPAALQPSACRGGGSAEQSSPSLGSGRATCPTPSLAHVSAATAAAAGLFMSGLLW